MAFLSDDSLVLAGMMAAGVGVVESGRDEVDEETFKAVVKMLVDYVDEVDYLGYFTEVKDE